MLEYLARRAKHFRNSLGKHEGFHVYVSACIVVLTQETKHPRAISSGRSCIIQCLRGRSLDMSGLGGLLVW